MRVNFILSVLLVSFCLYSCNNISHLKEREDENFEDVVGDYNSEDDYDYSHIEDFQFDDFESDNFIDRKLNKHSSRELKSELMHTKLEVSFNWTKSQLMGKATLKFRPKSYPQSQLELDAKGMDIIAVAMNNLPCAYTYEDSLKLVINLDRTYKIGEEYIVSIEYVSKPEERETSGSFAITSDKGLYFINPKGEDANKMPQIWTQGETESSSVWFPTIDAPNVKTAQEIYITVEDKYVTLSNGILVSSKKDKNGLRTDYWKQDKPHAPYLFMLAVGEFALVEDNFKRNDGSLMNVNYYVEPEYKNDARDIFGETPEMIRFFSNLLGVEYVWDKYSQIVVREYVSGAMENTGAVVFGDFVYKNKRELMDDNDQSTIAHELFHHWFGDLVTCESWSNLPLNESFANYSQFLWDEYKYGEDEAAYNAIKEADGYFQSSAYQGYHDLIWFDYNDKEDMFDAHSYNKGGRILHMLRKHLGDEVFFRGLNKYLVDNKYKSAEYNQLRIAFEEISGKDLNWFFDQWFLDKGHPVLFIDYDLSQNESIKMEINQVQNKDFPIFRIPVQVGIWDDMGYHEETVIINDEVQECIFSYKGNLKNILFDVDQMVLGRVFEEKPLFYFLNQLKNKKNAYKARLTAFNRLKSSKYSNDAIRLAIEDPHYSIRNIAVNQINEINVGSMKTFDEGYMDLLSNSFKTEQNSKVQAALISTLSNLKAGHMIDNQKLKDLSLNQGSYLVQQAALTALSTKDSDIFKSVIDSLVVRNEKKEKLVLCDVLSQIGDDSMVETLETFAKEDGDSEFEFRTFIAYMVFVTQAKEERDRFDWIQSLCELYKKRNDKNSGMFKMYSWRINAYIKNFVSEIIETLNQQIADSNSEDLDQLKNKKENYERLLLQL